MWRTPHRTRRAAPERRALPLAICTRVARTHPSWPTSDGSHATRACTLPRTSLSSLRVRAYTRAGQGMWPVSGVGGAHARTRVDEKRQIVMQMVADYVVGVLS